MVLGVLLHQFLTGPRIILPLLVVAALRSHDTSLFFGTLLHNDSSICGVNPDFFRRLEGSRLTLAYCLLLYGTFLTNSIVYCLRPDFNIFGLPYSIYGKGYQFYPICPIGTTAHEGWDESVAQRCPLSSWG